MVYSKKQWIIAKGKMVNWPIAFTKCYGAIPVSYGTIGNKSAQKAEYNAGNNSIRRNRNRLLVC